MRSAVPKIEVKADVPVITPAAVLTKPAETSSVEDEPDQPAPLPKPASSPLGTASRVEMGAYLREKRIHVTVIGKGRFQIAGRFMDHDELLDFANELRREDGLPEFEVA